MTKLIGPERCTQDQISPFSPCSPCLVVSHLALLPLGSKHYLKNHHLPRWSNGLESRTHLARNRYNRNYPADSPSPGNCNLTLCPEILSIPSSHTTFTTENTRYQSPVHMPSNLGAPTTVVPQEPASLGVELSPGREHSPGVSEDCLLSHRIRPATQIPTSRISTRTRMPPTMITITITHRM